jgi:TorA maturation chaperone TorD
VFGGEVDPAFWPRIGESLEVIDRVGGMPECPGRDDIVMAGREFREYVCAVDHRDLAEVLIEIGREYAALFLGVGAETVPLCESAYVGATATLCQDAYFDVRRRLRDSGLARAEDFTEPEDHLALELALMARLSRRMSIHLSEGAATWRDALAAQESLLSEHLLNWALDLTERVNTVAPGSFYASASRLLAGFLTLDRELIDLMGADGIRNVDVERHA